MPHPAPKRPPVVRTVVAVGRREGPQAEGAKQVALTDGDNLLLRFRAEGAVGQAHRQYLIGTNIEDWHWKFCILGENSTNKTSGRKV